MAARALFEGPYVQGKALGGGHSEDKGPRTRGKLSQRYHREKKAKNDDKLLKKRNTYLYEHYIYGMPPMHYRNTKKTLQIYTDNIILFGYLQGRAPWL